MANNIFPMMDVGADLPEPEEDTGIESLFAKYYGDEGYTGEAKAAKKRRDELIQAYKGTLAGAAQVGEAEPSQAERYFRLTQALLDPGKSGRFYETMGNVSKVAAEMEKEKRLARREQAMKALEASAKGQELDIEAAGADVEFYSKLAEGRRKIGDKLMEEAMKPREAQSPAGKQAMDEGLTPGTPDFHKRVADIAKASGDAAEARLNVALANAALSQAKFERSGTEMGSSEVKLLSETEDTLFSKQEAKTLVAKALELNPLTYDASIADSLARFSAEGLDPSSPKVVATRDLENILKERMLTTLKATFGAAPTEGERAVLQQLQGLEAKSKVERKRILDRASQLIDARIKKDEKRLEDIRSGKYRYRSTTE